MKNFYFKALLLCLCLLASINAFAYDAEIDGIYYNFSENSATVTYKDGNYNSYSGAVAIPQTVKYNSQTYRVTSIGIHAFFGCNGLTSISIPSGMTNIDNHAFRNCTSLTSITIPNSVTNIGNFAFSNCSSLNTITIPNSVTSIGNYAFESCSSLTSIAIPNSVTSIGRYAFDGCTKLTSVKVGWETPITIEQYTFSSRQNATLYVPIGSKNNYVIAEFWKEFKEIKEKELNVSNIYYSVNKENKTATVVSSPDDEKYKGDVIIPEVITYLDETYTVTSIGDLAFYGCSSLTSITIPESVTSIGSNAFYGCSSLITVTLKSDPFVSASRTSSTSMKSIFGNQVTKYVLGENVQIIGSNAFYGCTGMTAITIPSSLTGVKKGAFYGCTSLEKVIVTDIAAWCGITYEGTNWKNGDYPLSVTPHLYNDENIEITEVVIPEGVTRIEPLAFRDAKFVTSVTIPESVTYIGAQAFRGMHRLTSINIPRGVTSLEPYLFQDCETMTFISIPEGVSVIKDNVFSKCYALASITIPKNVVSVGKNVFHEATTVYTHVGKSLLALWNAGYSSIKEVGTNRELNVPTISHIKTTASSLAISYVNLYPELTETVMVSGSSVENGYEIKITGLKPNNLYDDLVSLTLSYEGLSYTMPFSFRTDPLTLTTKQPKVINAGNVIVSAESNLDDEETNVGFEWRRTDWTSDFASNTGTAYLYEGKMEGYIRNLYTEKLWKYRPYYESDSGNRYYGEWVGIDPTNTSYFEPTVHTYAQISVTGNRAEVKGYAMRGTDNVQSQGFMYWQNNTSVSLRRRATSVPGGAMVVNASGYVMTATLEDLEYETTYKYVAFVTTSEGETFYGEMQTFTTSFDPDGIEEVKASEEATEVARYDLQGRMIAKPQKGINIIRYSDGTSKKVLVK